MVFGELFLTICRMHKRVFFAIAQRTLTVEIMYLLWPTGELDILLLLEIAGYGNLRNNGYLPLIMVVAWTINEMDNVSGPG